MRWIAVAAMVWGVVLGATNGPLDGAIVIGIGMAALLVATPLSRAAHSASAHIAAAEGPRSVRAASVEHVVAQRRVPNTIAELDLPSDAALLDYYWNFRRIEDVAALAGITNDDAQERLIALLLDPVLAVRKARSTERFVTSLERRDMIDWWNNGESLQDIARRTGRSEWTIGRVVLENMPQPVGLPV